MRILSVIPAAEGLNTLPNRNLRVICGKPLICYAINNAKESIYINDIIVTSNSDEILVIAEQMGGVKCYKRPEALCGIDIPLERVIDDVRNIVDIDSYDYVVTMQSISPTLTTSTLDKAIGMCINEGIDTMISVLPQKRYLWNEHCNKPVQLNPQRVSKYDLEPFYIETGAFFISRPKYITERSRIGGEIKLFHLDPKEAIDVMSFGNLKEAEFVLSQKKIAFFVNGNNIIGMGHIHRALMLADEFFIRPVFFYDENLTDRAMFGNTAYELQGIKDNEELIHKLSEVQCGILINDTLNTSADLMKEIRDSIPEIKIINFEDDGEGAKYADIVINALYDKAVDEKWKTGADYYIAPKLYLLQQPIYIKERVKDILITFGGADPCDYTSELVKIAESKEYSDFNFHIVIGPAYRKRDQLKSDKKNVFFYRDLDSLIDIMNKCDIAISSRGRTGFELAICGLPTICLAENEREERHDFLSEKNGYVYLGLRPTLKVINDAIRKMIYSSQKERISIQNKMQQKDLKRGREKVIELINSL